MGHINLRDVVTALLVLAVVIALIALDPKSRLALLALGLVIMAVCVALYAGIDVRGLLIAAVR